jgi:hypothetical protein
MIRQLAKLLAVTVLSIWTWALGAQELPSWAGQQVLTTTTSKGLTISMESEIAPLEINRIHSWLIRLNDAQGDLVSNAAIEFIGGMPEHNHGLPTQPQVTAEIEPGVYLLEGLRFHMQGAWRLELNLNWDDSGKPISDTVIIDFTL